MRYIRKKVKKMGAVLSMSKYIDKKESRINSYSIIDLILDPDKKKEADKYYSKTYEYVEKDDFAKKLFGKE